MDNFLEILIPLIFAAVYFFGNMFSGKSKEEEDGPPTLPRSRGGEGDPEAAERQRRIQEEIRRKITERRRASGGEPKTSSPAPAGHEFRQRRQEVEAPRQAREAAEARRERAEATREEPSAYSMPTHEREAESASPTFTWDESDNAYDSTMQARLKRIEATKRKAEKLRRQAAERSDGSDGGSGRRQQRTGGYFTGTVRESLQDPQAARVAFIYGEVLGRPVSLRKEASSVPGLS
jgi:hypothetical protein